MAEATIRVLVFDGARRKLDPSTDLLLTVRPQYRSESLFRNFLQGNDFTFPVTVPEDGSGFAILASAKGFEDAGVSVVQVAEDRPCDVHLMLLRRHGGFQFTRWDGLGARPSLRRFLMGFETDAAKVGARYAELLEFKRDELACLLNITAALELLALRNQALGFQNGLDYLKAVEWGAGIRQDRFFALASGALLTDVKNAGKDMFERELWPHVFHPGATDSYKQTQFREANLQITFHDEVFSPVSGESLFRVELDMDYYHDPISHALLEVVPNTLSMGQRKTSPRQIYVMRWMAGKVLGQEFNPLYTIA
jgi:hypothetical protein